MRRPGPEVKVTAAPDGTRHVLATAVVNETNRTVVAERVERADTFLTRLVGLLGRDGLAPDEALWIAPCKGIHTIGMRFTIDAVFLDSDLRVVGVRERVAPWRATRFVSRATSVLELAAGTVTRTGVSIGDHLAFLPATAVALEERA